jgi:hypothetical protein
MPEEQSLPPVRPILADQPSKFLLMERAVEDEYRPRMLQELQRRVDETAQSTRAEPAICAVADVPWSARTCARFPGGRVSGVSGSACRVTVARLAVVKVGLCWICWAGTWACQRLSCPAAGAAGSGGAISVGGASSVAAFGSHHQSHGGVAGDATIGTGGREL